MKKQVTMRMLTAVVAAVVVAGAATGGGIALEAGPPIAAVADPSESITGAGPWLAKLACAACAGAALAAGGSSVVGLIGLIAAHAAGAGICAGACTIGFS